MDTEKEDSLLTKNDIVKEKKKTKNSKQTENCKTLLSNLLSDLKSISIPQSTVDKKKLLITLKQTIINIEHAIQLLIRKKDYYKELINTLEIDIQKSKKIELETNIEMNNYFLIQKEIKSKYIFNKNLLAKHL